MLLRHAHSDDLAVSLCQLSCRLNLPLNLNNPIDPQKMSTETETAVPEINSKKLEQLIAEKTALQNLPLAVIGGLASSIIGAAIWAVVTVVTEYQIGWMAIGVGFLVGIAVRFLGKGMNKSFGYLGGAFALLGCLGGNALSIIGFVSAQEGLSLLETFRALNYSALPELMVDSFSVIDLLFYGLAIYCGYKYSFTELTDKEIDNLTE